MLLENIKFKAKDGYCPWFIYCGKKYYIRDEKINGKRYYRLEVRDVNDRKTISLENEKDAYKYILNELKGKKYTRSNGCSYEIYETINYIYVLENRTVKIIKSPKVLSCDFENYKDCLEFSKSYIKDNEISLF